MLVLVATPPFIEAAPAEWQATPMHHVRAPNMPYASPMAVSGYSPSQIRAAYNLPSTGGQGTLAIVDAYDNPNAASDLAVFCSQFGLPSANLEVHKMASTVRADSGWGLEIALDVQWAHAIAPNAKILLVEATSNSLSSLVSAIDYAKARSDVVAVSMSWGGSEFSSEASYDSHFTSNYGATFYASSGDSGAGTIWPSVSSNVVAVGGTTLSMSGGSVTAETAWSGSGGGVSSYVAAPSYQTGLSYLRRAVPDVSYVADPATGMAVYDTYGYGGWLVVGGTSAGSPQWAAIQSLGLTANMANIYSSFNSARYPSDFRDVTSGSNGYAASVGYDLATGVGSPLTVDFSGPPPEDFTVSASPTSVTTNPNVQTTATISVSAKNGFASTVTLSASAPSGWTAQLSPTSVSASGSSTLTVKPPTGIAAGTYTVTVTATGVDSNSHTITHTAQVTVKVVKPDYTLSASPSSLTVRLGRSGASTISVNALNGYAGAVTLSAKTTTSRVTFSFSRNPITSPTTSTLTVNVASNTPTGTYTVTVTGVDSSRLTHTTTVRLTVTR